MSIFTRFLNDQSGATAIEYGLIAALVSVAADNPRHEADQHLRCRLQSAEVTAASLRSEAGAARPPPFILARRRHSSALTRAQRVRSPR